MPDTVLDAKALESYLPHRGLNLMSDAVTLHEGGTLATSRTQVLPGDARGRAALGRQAPDGTTCWYEPFLGEIMALTGLPLLTARLQAEGKVAVFSMISKLVFHRLAPMQGEVIGEAAITRDRGAFTFFATKASVGGQPLLEAEVMSGSATLAEIAGKSKAVPDPLPAGEPLPAEWFAWKPKHLCFASTLVEADAATGRVVAGYRYDADHPFVPGHFPGGPLMMGVTQWAAIADTAWIGMRRFGYAGGIANGVIRRPDGSEIIDVRDLELIDEGGMPRILSTKRIAFRDKVVPGESILIDVTVTRRP